MSRILCRDSLLQQLLWRIGNYWYLSNIYWCGIQEGLIIVTTHHRRSPWCSGYSPGATKAALNKPLNLAWNGLKSIFINQDDELVVCHDHTLERLQRWQGPLMKFITGQSCAVSDFGSWKSEQFEGERILTFLASYLNLFEKHNLSVNLEIKSIADTKPHVVDLSTQWADPLKHSRQSAVFKFQPWSCCRNGSPLHQDTALAWSQSVLSRRSFAYWSGESVQLSYELWKRQSGWSWYACRSKDSNMVPHHNDPSKFKFLSTVDAIFTGFSGIDLVEKLTTNTKVVNV